MKTILQIAIGMGPLLLTVIIMFIRKKHRAVSTVILLLAGISLFFIFRNSGLAKKTGKSQDQMLYLSQIYLEKGDYAKANDLINKVSLKFGESLHTAVSRARMMLLQGNIEAAGVLYEKAVAYEAKKAAIPKKEREFAQKIMNGEVKSIALISQSDAVSSYIKQAGEKPEDYGYETTQTDYKQMAQTIETGKDDVSDIISDEIDEYNDSSDAKVIEKGIDLKNELEQLTDQYTQNGSADENEVKKVARRMEDLYETNPELFTEGLLEDSNLEAMVLNKDYKGVVKLAGEGKLDALLMTANLYENQLINEDSFSEDFIADKAEAYEKVADRCKDILEKYEDKFTDKDVSDAEGQRKLTVLKEKVDTINKFLDNLALAEVRNRTEDKLHETNDENRSKTLLQLSGMDYFLGDNTKGDKNFEAALDSASKCSDEGYTQPLYNIMEVLSGNETDRLIKDTVSYAKEAYRNAASKVLANAENGAVSFSNSVTNYVSTKSAMINIGNIDTTEFPKVKVDLQFGRKPDNLNSVLDILDANEEIKNYTLTKKKYNEADIILVCDMSGSMAGSEGPQQSAISQFIDQMTKKENISLVGFDNVIQFDTGFTQDKDTLYNSAKKLMPNGGTDIYGAMTYSIGTMKPDQDASKIVIVMTDGNDNNMPDTSQLDQINNLCGNQNIIVYTIGMGDVNEGYLKDLANRGNGRFVYCNEAESLKILYNFIHTQLDNTYELTFEAVNKTDNKRILKLTDKENNCSTSKTYYLHKEEETMADNSDNGTVEGNVGRDSQGIAIIGMDQKSIYKSNNADMPVNALGYGFTGLSDVKVALVGSRKTYKDIAGTVTDDTHISFAVPKGAVLDTYAVEVSSNGKKYRYEAAFTICEPGNRTELEFGAYSFAADNITKTSDGYLLKGNVVMNKFLNFKGDITLSGNIKSPSMVLNDTSGAYVNCKRDLPGVLKVFFTNTYEVSSFGTLTLYNDVKNKYDFKDYQVDSQPLYEVNGLNMLIWESGQKSLYPDRIEYSGGRFAFDFPGQRIIFNIVKNENVFTFDATAACVLNGETLGFVAKVKGEAEKGIKLGTLPILPKELDMELNTLKHDYMIDASVGLGGPLEKLFEDKSFGMKLEWKDGKWDTILVRLGVSVDLPTAIPVNLDKFFFGVEEMSKAPQGSDVAKVILNSYVTGGMDIAVGKLASIIKPLKAILKDISLCTFEETKLRCRVCNLSIDLSTKLKLFGEIDMGESELKIGSFEYDNYLLDISTQEARGIYAKLKQGFLWDTSNIDIDVSGEGSLTLNNLFSGIMHKGNIGYDINIWKLKKAKNINGNILIGLHNNKEQFSIIIKGTDMDSNKAATLWLSFHKGNIIPDLKFY